MKASIQIIKSFDTPAGFKKDWEKGDFEEFFNKEGEYLDRLSKVMEIDGKEGDKFVVTYMVTVTKN